MKQTYIVVLSPYRSRVKANSVIEAAEIFEAERAQRLIEMKIEDIHKQREYSG